MEGPKLIMFANNNDFGVTEKRFSSEPTNSSIVSQKKVVPLTNQDEFMPHVYSRQAFPCPEGNNDLFQVTRESLRPAVSNEPSSTYVLVFVPSN